MKKFLLCLYISLFISGNVIAKVSDRNLSIWYNQCSQSGQSHELCKCHVEVMNKKLSNSEFENLMNQSWKVADWMKENVIPICGLQ